MCNLWSCSSRSRRERPIRKSYPDDVSDEEWAFVAPYLALIREDAALPTCRSMGGGLFEVGTDLEGNRIARVLFCQVNEELILLHGFMKKTQKTPKHDLDLAKKQMNEVAK